MASTARETAGADSPRAPAEAPRAVAVPVPRVLVLLAVAIAVVLAFLASMLAATSGRFVPQVLDLYVTAQYAKAMAEGHPFQYNAGDAPSTGATSLLHTTVLALAHALGARGEGLIAFAVLSGALFFLLTVMMAARIGARLGGPREGVLAGLLTALCGPVAWGFLYGADIALTLLLATWLLDRMLAGWHRTDRPDRGWIAAASLLALARPEGLVAGLALGVAYTLGPGRLLRRRGGWVPWTPALAGLAVLGLYRVATGAWVGSSVTDKSLLASYGPGDALALVAEYGTAVVRGLVLGFYPSHAPVGTARGFGPFFFPPLALALAIVAIVMARRPYDSAVRAWAAGALAMSVAVAPNTFMGVHFNRYLMWSFPSILALTAAGLGLVTRRFALREPDRERPLFMAFGALFVLLGLLSTARFAVLYGDMAGEIGRRDLAAAEWIRRNLPPGTPIANLATGVEYLTGHRAVNLHGVTSAAFFGNRPAERDANTLEALARLGAAERPSYLVTSVSRQDASPVMRELVEEPPLFRTSSLSDELLIHRMRYDALDRARVPSLPQSAAASEGRTLVDGLNVCDSSGERAHDYTFRSRLGDLRLNGTARVADYPGGPRVADAGRAIVGWERFTVRTQPQRELVIVLRTAPVVEAAVFRAEGAQVFGLDLPVSAADISLDGRPVGRATFSPRPGWDEIVVRVPAALVTREGSRLELKGRYAAFRYWFYQ